MQNAIVLNEKLARAIGQDAANSQMRKAGRKSWNVDDYNLACETSARLMAHVNPELGAQLLRDMGLS